VATPAGMVELDRAVSSIAVGSRHRHDLGDLEELVDSIRQLGLLQPITISPDGTLICGARRLAAVKQLGWRQVHVWVRAGVSDRLHQLLAEQHENTLRKPYTPREAAALYRELKALIAEDTARRQHATRFGTTEASSGAAESAAPGALTARAQAARLVTGRNSYNRLEQVSHLERLAADPDTPDHLRTNVGRALTAIDVDGKVNGHYQRAISAAGQNTPAGKAPPGAASSWQDEPAERNAGQDGLSLRARGPTRTCGVRAFVLTCQELSDWPARYDPIEVGPALTTVQWVAFQAAVAATVAFADAARAARALRSAS
jgi:ParB family transcriptional regulator, chromosome partitioning protein